MEIKNSGELQELDTRIGMALSRFQLPQVLAGIEALRNDFNPFQIAGITLFAIRYAQPPRSQTGNFEELKRDQLEPLVRRVTEYLLADPYSFDPPDKTQYYGSEMVPVLIRHVGNQSVYDATLFGQFSRALKLYRDIPRGLGTSTFDVEGSFEKLLGLSLTDFIDVAYTCYAAAMGQVRFDAAYFDKARADGLTPPRPEVVEAALNQLAGDQSQMRELYEKYKRDNRRYAAYDYNPLFVYPLVRPWPKSPGAPPSEDRLIAPVPGLILTRVSEGIYYQLTDKYKKDFTDFFGRIFENYVGELLKGAFPSALVMSEREIRVSYPAGRGKAPDWVVVEGSTCVMFECKATGLSRKAVATGDEKAIDGTVFTVTDGILQGAEFREACRAGAVGLEAFHACTEFRTVVVTFEPVHLINSTLLARRVKDRLRGKGVDPGTWHVLAIELLERLQPPIKFGISFSILLDDLRTKDTNEVLSEAYEASGATYDDSILSAGDTEIRARLGVP